MQNTGMTTEANRRAVPMVSIVMIRNIKHKLLPIALAATIAVITAGCRERHGSDSAVGPDSVYVAPVYSRIHDYAVGDSATQARILATDTAELTAFLKVVSDEDTPARRMASWAWSLAPMVFTPEVDSVFTGTDSLALALGNILARTRSAGLELPRRHYAAVVWGRPESVMFVDSVMLIAMNHYLGAESPAYDSFPLYLRLTKEPRLMPYDLAEALIATSYPYEDGDNATVLSRLLYEGALMQAKIAALPGGNLQDALGYRPEQYAFVRDEEAALWNTLVSRSLLYDTSARTAEKLVNPAPNVPELDVRTPGRTGRYIGARIVEAYMERHPDTTLPYLLSPDFYNSPETLRQAHYNP